MKTTKIKYRFVFNRKHRLNAYGEALLQVVASCKSRRSYFSTGIYLRPEQWNNRQRCICHHPQADTLNRLIQSQLTELETCEMQLWRQGRCASPLMLREAMSDKNNFGLFLPFCRKMLGLATVKESTRRNQYSTLTLLKAYSGQVTFGEVNRDYVVGFEQYLNKRALRINTIAKHLYHLKHFIQWAVDKELISADSSPFRRFKVKTEDSHHSFLTPNELKRFEQIEPESRRSVLRQTYDAFLFCCYTGLRYSDFIRLKAESLTCDNGHWLTFRSQKTGTTMRIPLHLLFEGKALNLWKSYEAEGRLTDLFRIGDNSNVNKRLGVLASLAGIDKRVTFHTARHTYATTLLYIGADITTVQRLLGHRSVRTTEIYTRILDETIVHDLEHLSIQ